MSNRTRNGATISGTISFIVVISVFILGVFFSLPSNVLNVRDGNLARTIFTTYFPQSWDFFTKSQQDPEFVVYRQTEEKNIRVDRFPNSGHSNFYGFSRSQRQDGPEIANITNSLAHSEEWIPCSQSAGVDLCIEQASNSKQVEFEGKTPNPHICGDIILVETVPVKWSFREFREEHRQPLKSIRVSVVCNDE